MYQHNQHSDMYRMTTNQHVSLDKHQQMMNNARLWQQHSQPEKSKPEPALIATLRPIFVTLLTILIK